LKKSPPGQHGEEEEEGVSDQKSDVKSGVKEDVLGQEPPVDGPAIDKNSSQVKRALNKDVHKNG
jgi:hypothetical protein